MQSKVFMPRIPYRVEEISHDFRESVEDHASEHLKNKKERGVA